MQQSLAFLSLASLLLLPFAATAQEFNGTLANPNVRAVSEDDEMPDGDFDMPEGDLEEAPAVKPKPKPKPKPRPRPKRRPKPLSLIHI